MSSVPDQFSKTIIELHGEKGAAWLNGLPRLLAECEQRWSLKVLSPFPLSYNYVAPAVRADGTEVVLKVGVPNSELLSEIEALRLFGGRGIAQLLEADSEQGVMLLERLMPGTPLSTMEDDEQATVIAARVMRELWRPVSVDHPFLTVADWAAGLQKLRPHFGGTTGPFPFALVEQAERLFTDLLASMGEPVLLHGDLHHYNIVTAQRDPWLALDPKGIVGEREYEVCALLGNPDRPLTARILARRIDLLADELGFDRQRLLGWGTAHAVLSAWWMAEDHGSVPEDALDFAEMMAELS
jgi:streptomycin 6-kinase